MVIAGNLIATQDCLYFQLVPIHIKVKPGAVLRSSYGWDRYNNVTYLELFRCDVQQLPSSARNGSSKYLTNNKLIAPSFFVEIINKDTC